MSWNDQAKDVASRCGARTCEIMGLELSPWGTFGNGLSAGDRTKIQQAFKEEVRGFALDEDPECKYQVLRIDNEEKKKVLVAKKGKKAVIAAQYPGGLIAVVIDDPENRLPTFRQNFEQIGDYYCDFFPK